ncbi:MAG TPA: diacylglycerol kinase [Chloroflexi bacterium]|nr:diacylglycerol kinase [Chloroflexota bacterium]
MNATLIFNPAAGQREVRDSLRRAVGRLVEADWTVRWRETSPTINATALARAAADEGSEIVIAAGGDGTINEVINGIVGSPARLGIMPVGTANIWAIESGVATAPPLLAQNLDRAVEVLLAGETVTIDLGRADGRYFLLMAGIGFDALVTALVEPQIKRRVGGLAYGWAALKTVWSYRGTRATIVVDGQEIRSRVVLITISNSRLYAGLPLAPDASLTDGLFDITVFTGHGWPAILRHTGLVVLGSHVRAPEVMRRRGRRVDIETNEPLPVQVDAEPIGQTPMHFEVVPQILRVIVPTQVAQQLLVSPHTENAGRH